MDMIIDEGISINISREDIGGLSQEIKTNPSSREIMYLVHNGYVNEIVGETSRTWGGIGFQLDP